MSDKKKTEWVITVEAVLSCDLRVYAANESEAHELAKEKMLDEHPNLRKGEIEIVHAEDFEWEEP